LGQQIGGGITNSKPPGRIIMRGQSETLSSKLDHVYYTLFCCAPQRCCTFHQPLQPVQLCRAKTIFLSRTTISWSWIFFIQFYCAWSLWLPTKIPKRNHWCKHGSYTFFCVHGFIPTCALECHLCVHVFLCATLLILVLVGADLVPHDIICDEMVYSRLR
jgi:hypothetical protein